MGVLCRTCSAAASAPVASHDGRRASIGAAPVDRRSLLSGEATVTSAARLGLPPAPLDARFNRRFAGSAQRPMPQLQATASAEPAADAWADLPGARAMQSDFITASGLPDYYCVLGVDDDAAAEVIKVAYRALAKSCHPDQLGQRGHNICILLNEAYAVLSDPDTRQEYNGQLEQALRDTDDNFTGQPLSKWLVGTDSSRCSNPHETRAVFVDEETCIGCTMCASIAPGTFRIEKDHGRSRVFAQWANTDDETQDAVDSCPVDCIHWVQKDELAALEWVMQEYLDSRTNVGMMMSGQGGGGGADVFQVTATYMKKREAKLKQREKEQKYSKAQAAAKRRAAEALQQQKDSRSGASWFSRVAQSLGVRDLGAMAASYVGSSGGERVGTRKRARPVAQDADHVLSDGTGTIPVHMSLVRSTDPDDL